MSFRDAGSIKVGNAALEPLFTSWLSTQLRALVVDRTDLRDTYNFNFELATQPTVEAFAAALRAQLGLTLEATETEVDQLVVDNIRAPSDLTPQPIERRLEPALLDRYVGRYALARSSVMRIVRDGERLLAQLDAQKAIEIFAASETEFFGKVIPARIEFTLAAGGVVTGLVLQQGVRAIHAARIADR